MGCTLSPISTSDGKMDSTGRHREINGDSALSKMSLKEYPGCQVNNAPQSGAMIIQ
ncbi:MAG: hypothetical protein ACJASX_003348 [Limisphaerales bacterium]|jgi:hypothetical protein